mgnify:CR=1
RARIQIGRISQFGLLEMSRQRLRQSFIDWRTSLSLNSSGLKVIYLVRDYINNIEKKIKMVEVELNPSIKEFITSNLIDELNSFRDNLKVDVKLIENLLLENDEIIIKKNSSKTKKKSETNSKKKNKKSTI